MDFLECIGQRYLERKAYAVPQQLENIAKKQFRSATGADKQAGQPSTALSKNSTRDEEIAHLRKKLAEAEAEKPVLPTASNRSAAQPRSIASPAADSRRSSTADAMHQKVKSPKSGERLRGIGTSKAAIAGHVAVAEAPPNRRASIDTQGRHREIAKSAEAPHRPAHLAARKVEYKQVEITSSSHWEHSSDRPGEGVYAIYVEEEIPRRQRAPSEDVIEVSSDRGRTIYRLR